MSAALRHLGISLGRVAHWQDGLGEFSRQLSLALARRAVALREQHGLHLHFHLPQQWHGEFGHDVGYLQTHTTQRWLHLRPMRFALWHTLHQHNRLRAPLGTEWRLETVHDLNFLSTKQGLKRERYRSSLARRLAGIDGVVAISHHVAKDLARELTPAPKPVRVIHNGGTDLTQAPRQAVLELRDVPYLLHLSRMAPSKNVSALIELAAAWPEQALVLAGARSPYTQAVQGQLTARGLRNVHALWDINEAQKAWLYANCQGFVFPSLTEGFGLPPIEAMHFGKPVFLSRLTSLPEVGGQAACYFDHFDPAHMRQTIAAGLLAHQSPDQAADCVAQAQRFNWDRCAAEYIATYLALLNDRNP